MRKGFTLVELIFVIVVLGIVVTIGSEIIVKVYTSYLTERSVHRGTIKTEIVSNEIANRLSSSISNTIIGRKSDGSFLALEDIGFGDTDYTTLQWVSYDNDSFGAISSGGTNPGWSGFVDLNKSSKNKMKSLGSNLTLANSIIENVSKNKNINNAAIFFPEQFTAYNIGYGGDSSGVSKVLGISGDEITLNDVTERRMKEFYQLAWSSYAIVPINCSGDTCDLVLRYGFQPWNGSNYNSDNVKSQILMRDVTTFKFMGTGSTFRFKLCKKEKAGNYERIICKEKAVIK